MSKMRCCGAGRRANALNSSTSAIENDGACRLLSSSCCMPTTLHACTRAVYRSSSSPRMHTGSMHAHRACRVHGTHAAQHTGSTAGGWPPCRGSPCRRCPCQSGSRTRRRAERAFRETRIRRGCGRTPRSCCAAVRQSAHPPAAPARGPGVVRGRVW
jgi:hypothetical protein